ncbi:hypothetical protein B9Z55_003325 [Caenorhabditis nigoni]|uniref:DUF281 domain-containing protein n=1 Tax=Caenorhabditis nigoni TaxID=1611254 RepID=A0A2G5VPT8_9PELO|nr:hypothetical protein B9Z55_003325 [Caenorhabditis nigoni]
MTPILLFLLFPTVIHGCLVIRFSAPPKCECVSMTLDQSNVQETVGNLDFYKNLTNYPISKPIIKIDDCSVSVYCERDSSLVIFDKEDANMFGAYAADGFCDPYKQKWIIEKESELKTYDKMDAICVDYADKADKCKCPSVLIDMKNVEQYFSNHKYFDSILGALLEKPQNFTFDENSCLTSFACPSMSYFIFPDSIQIAKSNPTMECDQNSGQFTIHSQGYFGSENATETVPIAYISCFKPHTLPPGPIPF